MVQNRVVILHETSQGVKGNWNLCFQYCLYEYEDETEQNVYRFIWRGPDGSLQGSSGETCIPSVSDILELTSKALAEGWGHFNCDSSGYENIDK
jgi:hypothetical protein